MLPKRGSFILFSAIALVLSIGVGLLLWGRVQVHSLHEIRQSISHWQPIFSMSRWCLIGLFAYIWPEFCKWQCASGFIERKRVQPLSDLRWRILAWLILLELMLGQGIVQKLITLFYTRPL